VRGARPELLLGAVTLIFPMIALKTARWIWLQRAVGIDGGGFTRSFLAYLTGMYAGLITPGRVGELIRVRYLTNGGADLGPALSTVFLDRLIDILGLLALGLMALAPLAREFLSFYLALVALAVAAAIVGVLFSRREGPVYRLLRAAFRKMVASTGSAGQRVEPLAAALNRALGSLGPIRLSGMAGLTLAGWMVYYLQAWALAAALRIPIGLPALMVSTTTAAVAALVPVSISGLGTRDAVLIVLFRRFGLPSEEAVAFSSLVFLMLVANAVFGFLASQWLESRPVAPRATEGASPRS